MKKRQYNAVYRLRKKGIMINTLSKTIFAKSDMQNCKTIRLLIHEFHFVQQVIFF